SILDLGCGDGRVGRALIDGTLPVPFAGRSGTYVGVDVSPHLLGARAGGDPPLDLRRADLSDPGWIAQAGLTGRRFDAILLFSVLHHIPSDDLRQRLLGEAAALLARDGALAVSVWQFLHLERFRRRIVPWSEIGIRECEVDPGDRLLDWREGGRGLRYVHELSPEELRELLSGAGLRVRDRFRSDGETGDLGLYVVAGRDPRPVSRSDPE
ncbi:MAG: methyltransferase domain-containing protein, partial [Candidatus Eisenbacteria bacterium]|nr:methyltransferase domain-containing protein [Candidatus Latescibacterota bacterium]MBD3303115.1 methyltransferase domain-containing protein [Candidatus Eisenbacteria bacterium]